MSAITEYTRYALKSHFVISFFFIFSLRCLKLLRNFKPGSASRQPFFKNFFRFFLAFFRPKVKKKSEKNLNIFLAIFLAFLYFRRPEMIIILI